MSDEESSVRVAVRIRPQVARELIDKCRVCTSVTAGEPQVTLGSDRSFTYDHVFDMQHDQQAVYEACARALVNGSLQGYNATLLAYGQTGSGKTYTMGTGFDVSVNEEQVGIIPRAINQIFSGIDDLCSKAKEAGEAPPQFKVAAQFLELYNEEIIDLFDPAQDYTKGKTGIRIHEDTSHSIYVTGITSRTVHSAEEALQCLRQGALSRTTASTQMNSQSSRSHAIFTLHIRQQRIAKVEVDEDDNDVIDAADSRSVAMESSDGSQQEFVTLSAKFHFVDLAGSERLKRTGATGDRAKEGISINCGLLALGNVISALGDKTKRALHVPYRDSKLTRLLQDSLGGNSRTVMIACVSPSDRDFMETLNTLQYANRARNIQNKVILNQDKSSRTISILRHEIQKLQLELMEYKQGKRIVGEDGMEAVNDMFHENTMLQNELSNFRTRMKAMQETIDALTMENTRLLAEKATSAWLNSEQGCEGDMTEMIQKYLAEIVELRAKLLESEAMCQQLRKHPPAMARRPSLLHQSVFEGGDGTQNIDSLLEQAKKEVEKEKEALVARGKEALTSSTESKKRSSSDSERSDSDEAESESESESEEQDQKDEEYTAELAELTSNINVKQKLIEELEKSQKRLQSLKQHYEDKLLQLQARIRATEEERDTVLASFSGQNNQPTEKVRRVREEYEKKLNNMQKEVRSLQTAKKEHAKMLRNQSQYESQIRTLKNEVSEMKRIKVRLINKMKEETAKHKETESRRTREIAQLRKERRKHENVIRSLEAEKRAKDVVLKRKQEEVSALRRVAHHGKLSNRAAGRLRSSKTASSSPKIAKQKWTALEKNISSNTLNKQSIVALEREMERLINERKVRHLELESKLRRLNDLQVSHPREYQLHRDLEDEIESLRANLQYIQESIQDSQQNILQVEESKNVYDEAELVSGINDLAEASYIIGKLYNIALHHSCSAAQKDAVYGELQAKYQQLEREAETQRTLLEHIVGKQGDLLTGSVQVESTPSSDSSRSNSPTAADTTCVCLSVDCVCAPSRNLSVRQEPPPSPSPVLARKAAFNRQDSTSPRMTRRATYILSNNPLSGKHGSMEQGLDVSPPNSPPVYRRTTSREENVFSRLTSGTTQGSDHHTGNGVITQYMGKASVKAPLICTHVAEGHSRAVVAVAATDDHLFSASRDRTVKVWDLSEGKEMHTLAGHPNTVVAVKFDSETQLLYCASSAYIRVWDLRSANCVRTLSSSGVTLTSGYPMQIAMGESQVNDIALNHSGQTFYSAAGDKVRVWDIRRFSVIGKLSGGHQAPVMCIAVGESSVDEDIVVTGSKDHYIKVFDVAHNAGGVFSPRVNLEPPHYDGIQSLAIRGDILFSGSRDSIIKKWDLEKQEMITSVSNAHKDWVCGLAFVPGQPLLLSVCRGGILKLWSAADSCTLLGEMKAHDSPINAITTNTNHVFTASNCGDVKIWRLPHGSGIMTMSTGRVFELSV
ncbi:hypothetical protein LSTR_LSTR000735 [Laodelphax striatellus]|uniref:Kinesin motor domain-containing protein n=1 Tax=Laodelphax striatellus TaxID=195883 RepID=A0A482XG76_LAOST|nr:hypothetical protein LSTR_LSTR000735 [Laodelphax striatellus]